MKLLLITMLALGCGNTSPNGDPVKELLKAVTECESENSYLRDQIKTLKNRERELKAENHSLAKDLHWTASAYYTLKSIFCSEPANREEAFCREKVK